MSFENSLENQNNTQEDKEMINQNIEAIRSIEKCDIQHKLDLASFVLDWENVVYLGTSEKQEIEDIKKIFENLKVPYVIEEGPICINIAAGKAKEDLDKFLKAKKEKDDKTMGLLLGYPKTAVEAYDTEESLDFELFLIQELSKNEQKKLEEEGVLKFLPFKPSRKHWQEELDEVRKLQFLIREKAPQLYEAVMKSESIYSIEYQKKKAKLKQISQEVETWVDKLGKGIDAGIKDTVIFLNALDMPTSDSCEGHIERGLPVPYVEIKAPNEPAERFIGENKVFEKVAKKYNISIDEIKSAKIEKVYWEAMKEYSQNEETEEYKKWGKENKKLMQKASELLEEFYKEREVEPNIKLQIDEQVAGFRIHNGGEDYQPIIEEKKEFSEKAKKERAEKLKKYRTEMENFTNFLIDKYFERS